MKDSFRLVQTGDLHLGSPFAFAPEQASSLQKSQLDTFFKMIRHCQEVQADALLIAGDFFDQPNPDLRLVREVIEMLGSLTRTRVLITPGNHDPLSLESPYRTEKWPDFVTIFGEKLDFVEFADHQLRVYGIGFTATVTAQPLLSGAEIVLDPDFANVLLIHGDLDAATGQSPYNTLLLTDLAAHRFDYVALGHIHQYSGFIKSGRTTVAYAGCPFGRGFDETGAKGLISGELSLLPNKLSLIPGEKPRAIAVLPQLSFVALGSRQFVDLSVDISGMNDQQAIADRILQTIVASQGSGFQQDLYKIRLTGAVEETFTPSLTVIEQRLSGHVSYFKLRDKTRKRFDLESLSTEHSLRGAFVRQARERIEKAAAGRDPRARATAERALELGILAMQGEEVTYAAE